MSVWREGERRKENRAWERVSVCVLCVCGERVTQRKGGERPEPESV